VRPFEALDDEDDRVMTITVESIKEVLDEQFLYLSEVLVLIVHTAVPQDELAEFYKEAMSSSH